MAGPWEKYQQAAAPVATGKPWEKFAGAAPQAEEAPPSRPIEAAVQKFGKGASMGYLSNMQAGLESLIPSPTADLDASLKDQGFEVKQQPNTYTALRDQYNKNQESLSKSNPWISGGAELAGGIAMTPAIETGVGALAPAASVAKKAMLTGAAIGGAQNPGDVEGEVNPIQLGSRAVNTAVGGVLGYGANKLASKLGSASQDLTATGENLETLAEKNALRNVGAQKPQMKALNNQDRVKDVGRFIIDEGIAPVGAGADDIAENALRARSKYGQQIGSVFDEIEKTGGGGTFQRKEVAQAMRDALQGDDRVAGALDSEEVLGKLEKYITSFEKGEGPASAKELLALKGKFDGRINYSKKSMDLPELQQGYQNLRTTINEAINNRAESLSNKVRGDLAKRLKDANRNYGLAASASDLADNKLAMEGNNFLSLSDKMAGGIGGGLGLMHGGLMALPYAAAGAAANKALRILGPGGGTAAIDSASRGATRAGEALAGPVLPALGNVAAEAAPAAVAQFQRAKINPWTTRRSKE